MENSPCIFNLFIDVPLKLGPQSKTNIEVKCKAKLLAENVLKLMYTSELFLYVHYLNIW